jgi:hypothetical protein
MCPGNPAFLPAQSSNSSNMGEAAAAAAAAVRHHIHYKPMHLVSEGGIGEGERDC